MLAVAVASLSTISTSICSADASTGPKGLLVHAIDMPMQRSLPRLESRPGTYTLILSSSADLSVSIGRLGSLHVQPGFYAYVGSAFGPGGVRARVAHHCRRAAQPHWHIDYLRRAVPVTEIWYAYDQLRREHQWAAVLQQT